MTPAPPAQTPTQALIAQCVAHLLAERIIAPFRADDVAEAIAECVAAVREMERDARETTP